MRRNDILIIVITILSSIITTGIIVLLLYFKVDMAHDNYYRHIVPGISEKITTIESLLINAKICD